MSSERRSVLIVHVPYEHRGGEDTHVEMLARAYEKIGMRAVFFPENREPETASLGRAVTSLLPGNSLPELERAWATSGASFIHLHNVYPILGPRFFRWAIAAKVPVAMTVHNHRFYCTNGIALRDDKICKDCRPSNVAWRAIAHNCNDDIKKSAYYALAISQARTGNLYERAIKTFIAPSPYIQDELVRIGMPRDRVVHVLNPIAGSETRGETNDVEITNDVFYAGRLSREKGIATLLETIRLMPERRFAIAGGGPLENDVREAATKLPNLKFLGSLKAPDVLAQIARSRVGVLPSICNEILPSFVLECFYQGKRCVVPALESTSWLAQNDMPGIATDTSSPQALERTLRDALDMPFLSADDTAKLQERLSFSRFCRELDRVVRSLLGNREQ